MKQKGFVLIVSLIFMAIMAMLAIYMFSGFITDEAMSGNVREKSRAMDAAQMVVVSAENQLAQPGFAYSGSDFVTGSSVPCAGVSASAVICSNPLANPTTLPWAAYTPFAASGVTVNINAAGGQNTYAAQPNYYIQYLGVTRTNPANGIYQITTSAQGGNATAVAVTQAVEQLIPQVSDVGGPN